MTTSDSKPKKPVRRAEDKIKFFFFTIIQWLLIIGLVVMVFFLGKEYALNKERDHALKTGLVTLKGSIDDTGKRINLNVDAIEKLNKELIREEAALQKVRELNGFARIDWQVSQAEYLVTLARSNFHFEKNIDLGLKLLNEANLQLSKLSDPRIYPIREALTNDIEAINAIKPPRVTDLYLRITGLSKEIDRMPMAQNQSAIKVKKPVSKAIQSKWNQAVDSTFHQLSKIIVVRNNLQDSMPFITATQAANLKQNLHNMFTQMQWAVLHHDQAIFQSAVSQAENWILNYYDPHSQITKNILEALKDFKSVQLEPKIPGLEKSLQAFSDYEEASIHPNHKKNSA